MPRGKTKDPETLARENRSLRAENRRLKAEARQLRAELAALAIRVDEMSSRQAEVGEVAERTESMLRWLRARMQILERELGRD